MTKKKFLDILAAGIILITFIAIMAIMSIIIGYGGPWYAYLIWPAICAIVVGVGWAFHRLFGI